MTQDLQPVDTATSPYLSGRFAPIHDEVDARDMEVEGEIPTDLNGTFIRNGANPQFTPLGSYTYPMEGDAMLHSVSLEGGTARYRNRFVRTKGFLAESRAGHPLFGGLMTPAFVDPTLLGEDPDPGWPFRLDPFINVIRHDQGYLALGEGVPPYLVTGELDTVGLFDFGGALTAGMTAHPKRDPVTGELVSFCYGVEEPFLTWAAIGADGSMVRAPTPVDGVDRSYMIHDFAVTEHFAVFVLGPTTLDMEAMMSGGQVLQWSPELGTRIALVDRTGTAPTRWFSAEAFWVWHLANAFEDGDQVKVDFPQWSAPGLGLQGDTPITGRVVRVELGLSSGQLSLTEIDGTASEFPRIDDRRIGQSYRYAVMAAQSDRSGLTSGEHDVLVRHDLLTGKRERMQSDAALGETVFAPREGATEELDGYYITFGTSLTDGRSSLYIWDAVGLEAKPRAMIVLPQRVPHGLHGNWFPADQPG
jgi:carotenoid cleavage dioxygenase-like enzyme